MAAVIAGGTPLGSTSNVASYAYGAFTPAANDLLIVMAVFTGFTTTGSATCTSSVGGFTLSKVTEAGKNNGDLMVVFVANQLATAVSNTITVNTGGAAATGCEITVLRVSGITRTGTSAIRSFGSANGAIGVTPNAVMNNAALTGNPVIAMVCNQTSPGGVTVPASFTSRANIGHATPSGGQTVASRDSGHTSATVTWGGASATSWGSTAVEVDTSAAVTYIDMPVVMAGVGSLTPVFRAEPRLAVVMAGVGSLTPVFAAEPRLAVAMAGVGSLAGAVTTAAYVDMAVAMAGVGTVAVVFRPEPRFPVTLAGVGSLAIVFRAEPRLAVVMAGVGTLAPVLKAEPRLVAVMAGVGSLAVVFRPEPRLATVMAGIGSLVAAFRAEPRLMVVMAGVGTLNTNITTAVTFATTMFGWANLVAELTVIGPPAAPVVHRQPWRNRPTNSRLAGRR